MKKKKTSNIPHIHLFQHFHSFIRIQFPLYYNFPFIWGNYSTSMLIIFSTLSVWNRISFSLTSERYFLWIQNSSLKGKFFNTLKMSLHIIWIAIFSGKRSAIIFYFFCLVLRLSLCHWFSTIWLWCGIFRGFCVLMLGFSWILESVS